MVDNNKYVQDYVRDQIEKHEKHNVKYGLLYVFIAIVNEVFLLSLIWILWNK